MLKLMKLVILVIAVQPLICLSGGVMKLHSLLLQFTLSPSPVSYEHC